MLERSQYLKKIIEKYATTEDTILEIGSGDNRNVDYLCQFGFQVEGIDKKDGTAIEDVNPCPYDIIYTMSTLFLIKNEWVFPKIAEMTKKYLITIEGETTKGEVIGRDYNEIFSKLGFKQIEYHDNVFNIYGVCRVFQKL